MLFGFALNISYAAPNTDATDAHTYETLNETSPLSYMPRVYLNGYGGYSSGSLYMGSGELLQPVLLRYDRDLFVYGEGRWSNFQPNESWASSPWSGSLGLGYRQILDQSWVLGGYLLGGYSKTPTGQGIIYANPGLEALGKVWDFRVNGYIPVSKRSWTTQGWADDFGNNNYISYQGHNEYDAWFTYHETAGIGGDAQVGRTLFTYKSTLVKGYVDGYYFSEGTNKAVTGGGVKITAQPTSYLKFSLSDNYDNYAHNVAMFGVEISLYDLFTNRSKDVSDFTLQHRLFEPIDHNFAATGSGSVIPTAGGPANGKPEVTLPNPSNYYDHNTPERTNVWFFNGGGSSVSASNNGNGMMDVADGTYEHPFSSADFNQNWVKHIYDASIANGAYANAYLYFTSGQYAAYNTNGTNYTHVEIFPGESLWGRMGADKGFQNPATGANRPNFIGGFQLDSNTAINNLILQNNSATTGFDTGIILNGVTNVGINNSEIGVDSAGNASYQTGIAMQNNASVLINNSDVYAYTNIPTAYAAGIKVTNGSNVTAVNHSIIQGHSANGNGIGLYVVPNADGNAIMGNISGDGSAAFVGVSDSNIASGYGLYAASIKNNSMFGDSITQIGNISGVNFIGTGDNNGYGLFASSNAAHGTGTTHIGNISNSKFTGVGNSAQGYGLYAISETDAMFGNSSTTIGNISNSSFTGKSSASNGYGLYADSEAANNKSTTSIANNGQINNSTFSGEGTKASYGLYATSNIITGDGTSTTEIGNITGSTFTDTSGNGAGFDVTNINNNTSGWGVQTKVIIGNIVNSTFSGRYGFFAKASARYGSETTEIGNIDTSIFTGISAGFYAASIDGGNGGPAKTTIGSISNSTFTATGNNSSALVAESNSIQGSSTKITSITHSIFNGKGSGLFLEGNYDDSSVAGYNNPTEIKNYMINNAGDTFGNTPADKFVCWIGGDCS